jgi:hypothetical protein
MRTLFALAFLFLAAPAHAAEPYTITFDGGGEIGEFVTRYTQLRTTGASVRIDGMCLSACAIVTSMPADRVCITPSAVLGFHSAFEINRRTGETRFDSQSTGVIWHMFSKAARALVEAKGWDGLTEHPDFVFVEFEELKTIYKECDPA